MLLELNIENFAIIDKVNIIFTKGFNILTGETGAGKSIIIDAVSMILGYRARKEYIRSGYEKAIIEGLFYLDTGNEILDIIEMYGIEKEEDNTLLVTREIFTSGRSVSRINGRTVTLSMLKEITNKLVDIHGQHEHQSLLDCESHVNFVDLLGKDKVNNLKEKIHIRYNKVLSLKKELKGLHCDERERERKIDLLNFQIEEIDNANLKVLEEESLMEEYKILSNSEEIVSNIFKISENLNSNDYNQVSILDQLNELSGIFKRIAGNDKKLMVLKENLESAIYQIQDFVREIRDYSEKIEFNPDKLKELEDRIDMINKLKRKYGNTIQDILDYREDIFSELKNIVDSVEKIQEINNEIQLIEKEIFKYCGILSDERKVIAKQLEEDITNELEELNMNNVKFKIDFLKQKKYNINGYDKVEFLISTNLGEPLRPLSKIVSGGEMSRIMLAFKTILADLDNIPTLIFDEIDTGISGRTAQIISEKIAKISRNHQILCITHLPQIAAMADTHFEINKINQEKKVKTIIKKLNEIERINELSRLLGGVNLTTTTKLHAKEMIEMSKKIKFK